MRRFGPCRRVRRGRRCGVEIGDGVGEFGLGRRRRGRFVDRREILLLRSRATVVAAVPLIAVALAIAPAAAAAAAPPAFAVVLALTFATLALTLMLRLVAPALFMRREFL